MYLHKIKSWIIFLKWTSPICSPQCSLVFQGSVNHDACLRLSRCCICCEFRCQKKFPLLSFPPPRFPSCGQTLKSRPQVLDVAFQLVNSTSSCLPSRNWFFAGKHLQSFTIGPECLKSSPHLESLQSKEDDFTDMVQGGLFNWPPPKSSKCQPVSNCFLRKS